MSTGVAAMKMPDRPPMMNIDTNASAYSIGVVNWMLPPQIVPSQLKTLIAEGRAIIIVDDHERHAQRAGSCRDWNMWWPQTMKPRPAMPAIEKTIGL